MSGAVRAVMGALGRIYEAPGERPSVKRYSISFVLSLEVGGCFVLVAVSLLFAPFFSVAQRDLASDVVTLVVRWTLVIAVWGLVVGLLVRHAPAQAQTLPWVSLGATIVIGLWIIVSLVFYFYLTDIASYQSVFGSLAAVIGPWPTSTSPRPYSCWEPSLTRSSAPRPPGVPQASSRRTSSPPVVDLLGR